MHIPDYCKVVENMREWQPIETAPKDGTVIFVGSVDTYPTAVRWQTLKAWKNLPGGGAWCTPDLSAVMSGLEPTHWMPMLEKPPKAHA